MDQFSPRVITTPEAMDLRLRGDDEFICREQLFGDLSR